MNVKMLIVVFALGLGVGGGVVKVVEKNVPCAAPQKDAYFDTSKLHTKIGDEKSF